MNQEDAMKLAMLAGAVSQAAELYGYMRANHGGNSVQTQYAYDELTARRKAFTDELIAMMKEEEN